MSATFQDAPNLSVKVDNLKPTSAYTQENGRLCVQRKVNTAGNRQ